MRRPRFRVSRVGDSISGATRAQNYEYLKAQHEKNKEALEEIYKRSLKSYAFFTHVMGNRVKLPADRALSFADQEHVLQAVLALKAEVPTRRMSYDWMVVHRVKDIVKYIIENLASQNGGYFMSGTLQILA